MHHSTVLRFGTRQALLLACLVFVTLMVVAVAVARSKERCPHLLGQDLLNFFLDGGHLADLRSGCPVT